MAWPDQGSSNWKAKSAFCRTSVYHLQSLIRAFGVSGAGDTVWASAQQVACCPPSLSHQQLPIWSRPTIPLVYCLVVGFVSRSTQLDDRYLEDKDPVFASGTWWILNGHQLQTSPGNIPQLSPLKDPQKPWGHMSPCTCCAKLSRLFSCLFPGYLVSCTGRALN